MARIMRSRRLAFAAAGHCTPTDASRSGGGKSGNRLLPSLTLMPRNDEERIESGSLSVSDGDAVRSVKPSTPPPRNIRSLGVLAGVFCCGVKAAIEKKKKQIHYQMN